MSSSLKNTTIFITGATSGIGQACTHLFAVHGARLIICGRRQDRLSQLAKQLKDEHQAEVHTIVLDVRHQPAVHEAITHLPPEFKNIDVLINNAGGAWGIEPIHEAHLEDWETMIDTNVKGLLYLLHSVLPGMYARNHGHIVNIGSTAAINAYAGGSVYCGTKHAVNAITKALSIEAVNTAVRVSEIDPGMVETEFSLVRFKGDAKKADDLYRSFKPLTATDVADAIYFAITRPAHVNIAQIVLYSRDQKVRIPD